MQVKIVKHLSDWFKKSSRPLPWRSNPDPYSVWLSEIMLQQTQVATVLPYFDRFKKQFPEVQDLAEANLDQVLKLWAGLGYYSRARNLHRGAQAIHERIKNKKGFPQNREEWLQIPGVGEYTAGAIASIAYEQREPIVDGNVVRVLSRLYAISKLDPKKTKIWELSRELVNQKNAKPRIFNQALMELGALVCRPKNPNCSECPVQSFCKGKRSPEKYPEKKPKTVWKRIREEKWVLFQKQGKEMRIYFEKNDASGWREGLWDFPNAGSIQDFNSGVLVEEWVSHYTVTTHKIERRHSVFMVKSLGKKFSKGEWFLFDELPALPAPVAKAVKHFKSKHF